MGEGRAWGRGGYAYVAPFLVTDLQELTMLRCGGISSGVDELLKVSVEILSQTSLQSQMDRLKTIDNILLDTCAIHDSGRNSNRAK